MIHIVLYEPEIPANTGNIIRLCANTGAALHLVRPLGFELDDTRLKRAGLDYHEYARMQIWDSLDEARRFLMLNGCPNLYALTTHATNSLFDRSFSREQGHSAFVFGPETRGLPAAVLAEFTDADRLRLPMQSGSRSLNLSNCVAVTLYEAWRQMQFCSIMPAPAPNVLPD